MFQLLAGDSGFINCFVGISFTEKFSDVVQGTLKTFVGFLVLIGGAGLLANSLTPFAEMFQTALNTQGVVPSNEAVVAIALQQYGTPTALIMLVGMVVNILLARFTF